MEWWIVILYYESEKPKYIWLRKYSTLAGKGQVTTPSLSPISLVCRLRLVGGCLEQVLTKSRKSVIYSHETDPL